MQSKTSCFNGALLRKNLTRFWPLWGLWGLIWMFLIPLRMLRPRSWSRSSGTST